MEKYNQRAAMGLIIKGGKILAVSRKNDITKMGLPGGKVENYETYEEAVVREVKEETGISVEIICHIYSRIDGDFMGKTFLCQMTNENEEISTNEAGRVDWIGWEELFNGAFGQYNSDLKNHLEKITKLINTVL